MSRKINIKDFFRALASSSENETSENTDITMTIIEQTPGLIEGTNYVKNLEIKTTAGREEKKRKNGKRKETTNQKQYEEPNNIDPIKLEHGNKKKIYDRGDRIA